MTTIIEQTREQDLAMDFLATRYGASKVDPPRSDGSRRMAGWVDEQEVTVMVVRPDGHVSYFKGDPADLASFREELAELFCNCPASVRAAGGHSVACPAKSS